MVTAPTAPASRFAALSTPAFRRYWVGSIASIGSTQLMFVGMGWLVFRLTGSPFDLGLLGVSLAVPTIVFTLIGGMVADTWDRRRLLFVTNLAVAVLLALLATADSFELVEVWHVLFIAALYGLVSGFDWPARQALFATLVPLRQLPSAIALMSMLWQGSRMALPALGGVLIAAGGTPTIFALGAIGFATMCVVVQTLPALPRAQREGSALNELLAGGQFICARPLFYTLIGLTYILAFFGISYMQIMPVLADHLGAGSQGFGTMVSVSGIGSIIGTLLVMSRRASDNPRAVLLGSLLGAAGGFALFALVCWNVEKLTYAYYLALGFMVVTHVFVSVFIVLSMTVLQQNVPDRLRGRVMGLQGIGFTLIMLGGVFSGTLAELIHPSAPVLIGALILVAATIAANRTLPRRF